MLASVIKQFVLFISSIKSSLYNRLSKKKKKVKILEYFNFFFFLDFIKGLKFGHELPLLPEKLKNFHYSLLGRACRFIGGIFSFSMVTHIPCIIFR
jgi:hypothetical protein